MYAAQDFEQVVWVCYVQLADHAVLRCVLRCVVPVLQVNKKLEEVLTSKNSIIRALQYDVAKVRG
jgi:hypothetical protein